MLGLGEALIRERFNDDGFFCFGANVYSLHCNLFHPKNLLQESLKCVNNKIIQLQK